LQQCKHSRATLWTYVAIDFARVALAVTGNLRKSMVLVANDGLV